MAVRPARPVLGTLLVAALLAAGGCGSETTAKGVVAAADGNRTNVKRIDACAMLTQAEAEAVLGESVQPKSEDDSVGGPRCTWQTKGFRTLSVTLVEVMMQTAGSGYGFTDAIYGEYRKSFPEAKPFPGVGDEAWSTSGRDNAQVHVRHHGDRLFSVLYMTGIGDETTSQQLAEHARGVAQKVLARH